MKQIYNSSHFLSLNCVDYIVQINHCKNSWKNRQLKPSLRILSSFVVLLKCHADKATYLRLTAAEIADTISEFPRERLSYGTYSQHATVAHAANYKEHCKAITVHQVYECSRDESREAFQRELWFTVYRLAVWWPQAVWVQGSTKIPV